MTPAAAKTKTRSASLFQLDPEQVRSFLLHDAGLNWPCADGPREVHIERVWPAGREALAVEWSFELCNQGRYSLFVTPMRPDDPPGPDAREPILVNGVLRGLRIELQDQGILIHSPDHDPELLHLRDCLDPTVMNDRLTGFWRDDEGVPRQPSRVGVQVLSYRARRRAAFGYRCDGSGLIGKTFRDARGERAMRWHEELRDRLPLVSSAQVTAANPVGYIPDLHLVLFSWCDKARILSKAHPALDDLRLAMQALAFLHRTSIDDPPTFSSDDEVGIVERWRTALALADRTTADVLDRLVPAWQAQAPPMLCSATIHRDFYGRQVLLDDGRAILVDLDTLSHGDPAVDVGNFLAHLWLDALQHRSDDAAHAFETQARGALAFYRDCGGRLNRKSLKWFFASALLRLGAVHTLRTTTGRFTVGLWTLAAQILEMTFPTESLRHSSDRDRRLLPDPKTILADVED